MPEKEKWKKAIKKTIGKLKVVFDILLISIATFFLINLYLFGPIYIIAMLYDKGIISESFLEMSYSTYFALEFIFACAVLFIVWFIRDVRKNYYLL